MKHEHTLNPNPSHGTLNPLTSTLSRLGPLHREAHGRRLHMPRAFSPEPQPLWPVVRAALTPEPDAKPQSVVSGLGVLKQF